MHTIVNTIIMFIIIIIIITIITTNFTGIANTITNIISQAITQLWRPPRRGVPSPPPTEEDSRDPPETSHRIPSKSGYRSLGFRVSATCRRCSTGFRAKQIRLSESLLLCSSGCWDIRNLHCEAWVLRILRKVQPCSQSTGASGRGGNWRQNKTAETEPTAFQECVDGYEMSHGPTEGVR